MTVFLIIAAWYLIGLITCIAAYWIEGQEDVTVGDIKTFLGVSLLGPIATIMTIGFFIGPWIKKKLIRISWVEKLFSDRYDNEVVITARKKKNQ